MDRIREAVKDAGIFVVLGYSERDGDSLYISQSYINAEGKIVLHRRKIKPTRKFGTQSTFGEDNHELTRD